MIVSDEQRCWRLARRHRLTPDGRTDDVAVITEDLIALHSSDPATVYLSAWARMVNPSVDAVSAALYDERSVLRHHAMRRTLWVMTPPVARLANGAATAKIARAERKRTLSALGETDLGGGAAAWFGDATAEICALLDAEGPLSTRAIGQALPHLTIELTMGAGTKNPASLKAHTKVLQGAGFDATVVRTAPTGSWNSAEYVWAPMSSWLGAELGEPDEVSAAGGLLDRWLQQFGPATTTDIRWWFGWTASLAKKAIAAVEAVEVGLERGQSGWLHPADTDDVEDPGPWVRLLPGLDPTTMGWKERNFYLDPGDVADLFDRFGNGGPCIWADGRIVGAWVHRPDGSIVAELTHDLSAAHQVLLDDAIAEAQAVIGDVVVRPRFPAPAQKRLFNL